MLITNKLIMATNSQDSVYPILPDIFNVPEIGLRKREYFATVAMQGMLANSRDYVQKSYKDMAKLAVCVADALINELNGSE